MRKIRHNFLMLRHRLADVLTGPLALALLPVMLLLWNALDASVGTLVVLVTISTLAVLAALTDRRLRRQAESALEGCAQNLSDAFEANLRAALYRARLRRSCVLCIVIELNAHTDVSPDEGRAKGQRWSRDNAKLIASLVRRRDKVSILGRNRYGIVIASQRDVTEKDALIMARRLKLDIENASNDSTGMLDAVIGVSLFSPKRPVSLPDLISAANSALHAARAPFAPDVRLHTPEIAGNVGQSIDMGDSIASALESGDLCGWFQPQVSAKTGRVTGFETLARLAHPTHGVMNPGAFLPILKEKGMMPLLHERMLSEALDAFDTWRQVTDAPPAIGINLAPEDLLDPTLPDRIHWELDRRRIAPECLNIEVLESVVSQSADDVTACNINRLSELGCRVDLDDFGTGHASISSLQQFALHRLKIDRSFIKGIEANPEQENMVAAILTMAKQLGLDTVAEGVETPGEEARLARLGCGHLQGYGIARPMPLGNATEWLKAKQADLDLPKITRNHAM